jgi:hypothetical protein
LVLINSDKDVYTETGLAAFNEINMVQIKDYLNGAIESTEC